MSEVILHLVISQLVPKEQPRIPCANSAHQKDDGGAGWRAMEDPLFCWRNHTPVSIGDKVWSPNGIWFEHTELDHNNQIIDQHLKIKIARFDVKVCMCSF
jgi:hypothetical protein